MTDQDQYGWFVPLAANDGMPLYGFPHAGAGCTQLAGLARAGEKAGISLWSANLPGRQGRLSEPPITVFEPLVDALAQALIERVDDRPYAMFGYCAGALLAYGVLQGLALRGAAMPSRFVVVSYDAPDIARRPRRMAHLPREELWARLRDDGGVPESLAGDARLRQVAEPAVRADFAVLAGYRHRPAPPLPVPITVYFGTDDPDVERGALLGWRRHSSESVDLRAVPGGHWLVDDAPDELAGAVAAVPADASAGRPA
ncbi:thioesterase II family protein [Actinomadura welshii]|uniref:thioesterase II family protein n=1 Tax=Actinomadura welshii TaxID=3103817 RepID=UPI0003ACF06C|nr:alpha/beta fold hydrolase [Actinomadura madurae]